MSLTGKEWSQIDRCVWQRLKERADQFGKMKGAVAMSSQRGLDSEPMEDYLRLITDECQQLQELKSKVEEEWLMALIMPVVDAIQEEQIILADEEVQGV